MTTKLPRYPGLTALTVTEIKHLFTHRLQPETTTCNGSGGDDATKQVHDGSTTAPDSADRQRLHDKAKVRLEY